MFDEFYEKTQSITLSAEWTLDGLHRCSNCELVDELACDSNENISQINISPLETKLVLESGTKIVVPEAELIGKNYFFFGTIDSRIDFVETPPPRA